ncbi:Transcriptional regulatory protein [Pseudomonas amygdali pv. photiniae]|uniref:Transcriptional regulatory protein n=1 Tax=Pseudomonas amygdali pv. photiniae TaxID=251724 RepID=A0A0P9T6E6_PSEA0|nr:helix-turn-helix transcriptional regulator [Pseudomonas amygdali]KPX69141.1 Transcriptional regulatory protein [Pseudomonas amygdali pv. photiniae]RMS55441.1 Transcriptional regulatory protein [Pseudomonas amygdali pv. photiniae]
MPVDIQKVGTSVIPGGLDAQEVVRRSEAACAALSDDEDGLKRDILGHAGNRWSLGVVHALGVSSPLRHAQLRRKLHGVTQRMLTHRVEYSLTGLGMGLLVQMIPLWTWVIENSEAFSAARNRYPDR